VHQVATVGRHGVINRSGYGMRNKDKKLIVIPPKFILAPSKAISFVLTYKGPHGFLIQKIARVIQWRRGFLLIATKGKMIVL